MARFKCPTLGKQKITVLFIILGLCWNPGTVPSQAQSFFAGVAPDPEVLMARPNNGNGQNLESILVDIKAVDAPATHLHDGKVGVGSEVRYGQGIIIDSTGIIVTNRHVIGHATHIDVMLSDRKVIEAKVLRNSQADLCLIKVDSPDPLRAVSLADSSVVQKGLKVIAIANAGFNPQRIRGGEVINVFRGASSNTIEILEMNIPLRPGDSGGPILNEQGSLLGLIMGVQISDPNKSYAIASNRIQQEYFNYRNSILD